MNTKLEQRIKKRTRELEKAQKQLLRQERLAVLGQLAAGISHELRNPLGVIKNAAFFLDMTMENAEPQVSEALEILDKEVINSERIISSLLTFARPMPIIKEKVDINNILQETLGYLDIPSNIKVITQLDKTQPNVMADHAKAIQIFNNLIANAIQAMPDGGKLIIMSKITDPEWINITIKDSGVGISKENIEDIFEPLFTTKARGIGLGLAIANTLVKEHNGYIKVKSKPKLGTSFTVRLPIDK